MTQSQFNYLPILITESYVFNLRAHIKKFGIEDSLHFNLQFIKNDDLSRVRFFYCSLRNVDGVFVVPSFHENILS